MKKKGLDGGTYPIKQQLCRQTEEEADKQTDEDRQRYRQTEIQDIDRQIYRQT